MRLLAFLGLLAALAQSAPASATDPWTAIERLYRDRVREMYREPDGSGIMLLTTGVRLRVARGRWDVLEKALGIERL